MKQCDKCKRNFPEHMVFCPFDGEVLEAQAVDPLINRVVDGKYRIKAKIGEGGMGAVYEARHVMMDNPLAVKVLHATLVADKTAVARFQREAQAAARIKHPNAVTVTDFGITDDNVIYIVMELFKGQSLREILEKEKRLGLDRTVMIAKQVCAALDAAHRSSVIHRDVKPDNIVVEERPGQGEVVKVLDFGIAKLKDAPNTGGNLTRQGVIIGSPHYLSPEQCQSAELDARSDVYSFGVVLYEMLTGQVPFTANTPVAVALKHANEMPRSMRVDHPEIPEIIDKVVLRALSKEPERRQQSAVQLAEELEQAVRTFQNQSKGATQVQVTPGTSPLATKPLDLLPQQELIETAAKSSGGLDRKPPSEPLATRPVVASLKPTPAALPQLTQPTQPPPKTTPKPTTAPVPDRSATTTAAQRKVSSSPASPRQKAEDISISPNRTGANVPVSRAESVQSATYRSSQTETASTSTSDEKRQQMMIIGICVAIGIVFILILLFVALS